MGTGRKARVPESPVTYRVGMRWLTLTNLTKGFSLVRFLMVSLLIDLVTCRGPVRDREGEGGMVVSE